MTNILLSTTLLMIVGLAIELYPLFIKQVKIKHILIPLYVDTNKNKKVSNFSKNTLWLHIPTLRSKLKMAGLDYITYSQYIKLCLLSMSITFLLCILLFFKTDSFQVHLIIRYISIIIMTVPAFLIPRIIIQRLSNKRVEEVDYYLSPFIDLLLVCLDSGLSFQQSFQNATKEMSVCSPLIQREFSKTVQTLQVALDPGSALIELQSRLPSESLGSFIATITQNLEKGASLYDVLFQLSLTSYHENLLELEKKVEKLPMIVTTLAGFILLPAFLITTIAPLLSNLQETILK